MRGLVGITTAVCFVVSVSSAHAEPGIPVAPGGMYLSFEGGYHHSNTPGVAAQGNSTRTPGVADPDHNAAGATAAEGASATAAAGASSGTESAAASAAGGGFIAADDGAYAGATIGYALAAPVLGVTRVEAYATGYSNDDRSTSFGALGLRGVDNNSVIAMAAAPLDNLSVRVDQSLDTREFGLRFKVDRKAGPVALALSAEPFYLRYGQTTNTHGILDDTFIQASADRHADLDADLFGAQVALEATVPITTSVSWIGRGSVGVYNVSADAGFSSAFLVTLFDTELVGEVADKSSRNGYRLGAETGLRFQVNPSTWLSLTGSVDYLSDMPTAALPRNEDDAAAHIRFEDLFDWRTGIRLTFASNGAR